MNILYILLLFSIKFYYLNFQKSSSDSEENVLNRNLLKTISRVKKDKNANNIMQGFLIISKLSSL
jgi:hypothetical protein